jgi:glutamine synthetase
VTEREFTEIEVAWSDPQGHVLGKRFPSSRFDVRRPVTFCEAALAWNVTGEVQDGLRFTDWTSGFPDAEAVPDPATLRPLPWRPGAGQLLADVIGHSGRPLAGSPRSVLRHVTGLLAGLGYQARVGVELEFYLLAQDGSVVQKGLHGYSLEKAAELGPVLEDILALGDFVPVESVLTEYGPGQVEVNLAYADALTAADDAFRLRYAVKEVARRHGLLATFMAKPFTQESGSSAHVHVSLWRDGEPAFVSRDGQENPVHRAAIAGVLRHLPALVLFGAPTVNSYKRYSARSFAPSTATWGGDNRTGAVRSLVAPDASSRFELRSPGADCNPYWSVAAVLSAVYSGLTDRGGQAPRGAGDLYTGEVAPLPSTLAEAIEATRADKDLAAILGEDAVHDLTVVTEAEWRAYTTTVTAWETERYLRLV